MISFSLFLSLLASVAATYFSDPGNMSHFRREKQFVLSLHRADLVLDINMQEVTRSVNLTCNLLTYFDSTADAFPSMRKLSGQLDRLCSKDHRSWHAIVDFLTGETAHGPRPPRFILATIFSSLVAGISGLIWGASHSTSQTDAQLLANQQHLVQVLRQQEHSGDVTAENLKRLAAIVAESDFERLTVENAVGGSLIIISTFMYRSHEMNNLFRATETLLLHQKLSPTLLLPGVLAPKLAHLSKQANIIDRELSISQESDLFLLRVSFVANTDHILRIVVHIPVHDQSEIYTLYSYLPTPTEVNGQAVQLSGRPQTLLGVRRDTGAYLLPSRLDISACVQFQQRLSCSFTYAALLAKFPSCPWALFQANKTMITASCRFSSVPSHPQFWKLSPETFLVYQAHDLLLKVICQHGLREQLLFTGLKMVSIPAGCFATNGYFTLTSSQKVAEEDFHFQVPPLRLDAEHLTHHPKRNQSALNFLLRDVPVIVHEPLVLSPADFPHTFLSIGGAVTGLSAVLVTLLICACLFFRYRQLSSP